MTVSLLHKFVSEDADGTDDTLVRPSNWNDQHSLVGAPDSLLGFDNTGAAVEITTGTAGRVLVDQGAGSPAAFKAVSGDGVLAASGALAVSEIGGVAPGALYPLNVGTGLASAGGNLNLSSTGVAPGTYGSSTQVAVVTVGGDGRLTSVSNVAISGGGGGGSPGGSPGQIQYNNAGSFGGLTVSGDGTLVASTGVLTVTKTGGVAFAASATTDTTNAANISSGTLPDARLSNVITAGGPTGGATVAPIITYDAHGRLTAVTSATITPAASSITGGAALTKADDTNVTLTLGGSPASALLAGASITAGWTGTLAAGRLNANVVQSVTNDTNVTGSIGAQALTLGWSGILGAARGGTANGFFAVAGPSASTKTFTFPNASANVLTDNAAVTVAQGGTGLASLTSHAVLLGEGTGNVSFATIGTGGRVLIDQGIGADPAFTAIGGAATLSSSGALTLANTTVTAGTYGSATQVGTFTVGADGRVTAASNVGITGTSPGGTTGQVQFNSAGSFGGFTVSGDGTLNTSTGALTVTKTNGTAFGAIATLGIGTGLSSGGGNLNLTNTTITLNAGSNVGLTAPGAMSLGSTYAIGATSDTPRFAGLGLGGAATGANILTIFGGTSGHIDFKVPIAAGTNVVTFPAGTTDFSATGGTSQVVKQVSAGAAFTVGQLASGDISGLGALATLGVGTGLSSGAGNLNISSTITAGGPTGSATVTPIITYNAQGQLTTVTSATITPAASSITGGAALTAANDTNVTATLGGAPSTALLGAASLTLGWTGILASSRGGTANGFFTVAGPATSAKTFTFPNASANVLTDNAAVAVAQGGTGLATLTAHAVMLGEGTGNVSFATIGTGGRLLIDQGAGADPAFTAMSGDATITSSGAVSVNALHSGALANPSASIGLSAVNGSATTAMRSDGAPALSQAIAPTWTGQHIFNEATTVASATGAALDDVKVAAATTTVTGTTTITAIAKVGLYRPTITAGSAVTITDASTFYVDNSPLAAGSSTLTNAWAFRVGAGNVKFPGTGNVLGTITSGTWNGSAVGVQFGGTGLATLTAHAVLLGEGTGNVAFATVGTGGRVLIDQGASADPAFTAVGGDATLSSAGSLVVTKTNGTSFGAVATLGVGSGLTSSAGNLNVTAGQIPGTATNNDASAGNVGEFVTSSVALGSAVSLTAATATNVTSISLTAGDWDIFGVVCFHGAISTVVKSTIGAINVASATLPAFGGPIASISYGAAGVTIYSETDNCLAIPTWRVSLSGTTTYFLLAYSDFATSTTSAYGTVSARRTR